MIEKKNVPKLRFLDFTSPWEQHKVGELLIERNDKAPMSDEYPLMAFIAYQGVAPKGDRYDRSALINDAENKLYKKTEYGEQSPGRQKCCPGLFLYISAEHLSQKGTAEIKKTDPVPSS